MKETIKTLFKCLLTFIILLVGVFMTGFAFDTTSWLATLTILACILSALSVIIYYIWKI